MKVLLPILLLFLLGFNDAWSKDIIILDSNQLKIEDREAILVLTGFGSFYHSPKNQKINFKQDGYDLFIPDYIDKNSIALCSEHLEAFIVKQGLSKYKKIHVFAYILGAWTLNTYLEHNTLPNLASIIYDRSPLQERVPGILVKSNPFLSRLVFGKLIAEIAHTPYKAHQQQNENIGILIECKATKVLWKKKKEYDLMPAPSFSVEQLNQGHTDYCYFFISHDELYTQLEKVGPSIFTFYKTGKFSVDASKEACSIDPFISYHK